MRGWNFTTVNCTLYLRILTYNCVCSKILCAI
jgi:hypothetical protein